MSDSTSSSVAAQWPIVGARDLDILTFVASHPTASIEEAAEVLQCRPDTVTNYLRSMKERGFYAGTMALINYQKLDLAYVPVLVQAPIGSLNTLFRVVRVHPYIHYSVRTLGSTDGAFLVFIQPQNAMPSLIEFLDQLASRGVITGYRFFVNAGSKRSFPTADLRLFNPRTNNWDFDWGTWRAAEEKNESASDGGRIETVTVEPELHNLDKCDIELLRILTEDAQAATENIAKGAHLLPHEVRGRIKRLEEEAFVVGYRAMITYSKFHLSSTILFDCNARANEVELCRKKLLTLPFPGTFIPVQNGFLCQMTMPSEGLPPVQEFLARYCNNVAVSWYDLPTSDVAAFNAGSYADGAWRVDSGYVLEEPLKLITKEANP